jgi:flavin reductase (DIM6/NTAB) family NADH-FMN oxidoreductase RutF
MTSTNFADFIGGVDHPMIVVTTGADGVHAGCLVGFHAQCSMEPARYAVWLSKANRTFRVGALAEHFALHFLEADNHDLAERFGSHTGDDEDKFEECAFVETDAGVRVLTDCRARAIARRVAMFDDGGDHVCFVLEPVETTAPDDFTPLQFSQVRDLEPGHEPEARQRPR